MRAAVMVAPRQELLVEEVELDGPRQGEVLVRLVATGVCHTDLKAWEGGRPLPLPVVLGHEGAGIVEEVGAGVTTVAPGDHVLLFVAPRCGKCPECVVGQPQLCRTAGPVLYGGTLLDGTTRLRWRGQPLHHFFAQSSFAEYAVVPEGSAVKIRSDAPLEIVAVLSCGAATGIGAVLRAARVEIGSRVAIVGCGGVGLSAVMAARLARAGTVVAVDVAPEKLDLARELGATHVIDARREEVVERIREITGGGVDYAFEFVGSQQTQEQVVELLRPGGHAFVIGAGPVGTRFTVDANRFLFNKHLHGVVGGNVRAAVDLPLFVDLFMAGELPLDRLVTRRYRLEEINRAFRDFEEGAIGRSVVVFG